MGGGLLVAAPRSASCCGSGGFPSALFCANCERRTKSGFLIGIGIDGPYLSGTYLGHSVKLDERGGHVKFANPSQNSLSTMLRLLPTSKLIADFKANVRASASSDTELSDFLRTNPELV